MSNEERAASMSQNEIVSLLASHQNLQQQLDWLKRQLFGSKSERHLSPDDSRQLTFGELGQPEPIREPTVKVPSHERRLTTSRDGIDEGDLRFDDSVPVEQTVLPSGIAAADLDDYEKIGEKKTRHLAQKPGSYFVKEFVREVYKKKTSSDAIEDEIVCCPPPWTVFDRSFADVSLLAGL